MQVRIPPWWCAAPQYGEPMSGLLARTCTPSLLQCDGIRACRHIRPVAQSRLLEPWHAPNELVRPEGHLPSLGAWVPAPIVACSAPGERRLTSTPPSLQARRSLVQHLP